MRDRPAEVHRHRGAAGLVPALLALALAACTAEVPPPAQLRVPPGFQVSLYAENVEDARSLALGTDGTVYVGTRRAGHVYALPDNDRDGRADEVVVLAQGLERPNAVAVREGDLYVVTTSRVLRFANVANQVRGGGRFQIVYDGLPRETAHGWRYARFGPDGLLYVSVGAPCNVCRADPDRFAVIERMRADGRGRAVYARGVRNSVGFDWHPGSGALWFTDNGRDWLGDERPPDELNRAPRPGLHFGFPWCHGRDLADPRYDAGRPCSAYVPPVLALDPHVAALGMRFYTGEQFPARYRGGIFIAEHGSWNSSVPVGYRVMFVPLRDGAPAGYQVFADGWLDDGEVRGRPVDVLVMPDGALLVSDDYAGAVYRITHERD